MFYYFYIPLEKSHSLRAKKKKKSANMDYGFLDIGRDKAYHILFVFAQEWTRFLPFFSSMRKVRDTQCNVES